jgi:hypothetical protein
LFADGKSSDFLLPAAGPTAPTLERRLARFCARAVPSAEAGST